ncbi:hypothetical protein JOE49_002975 [Paenibacillus sp. PvR133]|nr:hypothetical protein [Paenibacillus sp. PvR133]
MHPYYRSLEKMAHHASIIGQDWNRFVEQTHVKHIQQGIRLLTFGDEKSVIRKNHIIQLCYL